MKLHYAGKYNGDSSTLPVQRMVDSATPFREPSEKKMPIVVNILSTLIFLATAVALYCIGDGTDSFNFWGILIALLSIIPHELLHAICFKEDVFLYNYVSKGMMFVVAPEDMSKSRFVFMNLMPNIVLGFLPFMLFVFNPSLTLLGSMGGMCISMGAGDYMNVFNALTQVPKGGLIYFYRLNTHWYMPDNN
jgi:hypothetical protein